LFCLLVGAGTWLFDGTAPTYLPSRPAWLALLGAGAVLGAAMCHRNLRARRSREPSSPPADAT
jgi:hypothetical protein